ncbi:MAG: hypothetical protein OXS29_18530 [bacterium]|nr:hypothetical protein [bacterium]MDE0289349.1 hypothetical protein [bacterium]MDE0439421.1 hypothetical protein [bacterium]
MSNQPSEDDLRLAAPDTNRYRQFKSVGAKVAKAPQGAASVVRETSRVAYGYSSRMVRDLRKADLRLHTNTVELAQAITSSAQATITDLAGNAATQVGNAGNLAGNAATQIGNVTGTAATVVLEQGRTFRDKCGEPFKSLNPGAKRIGDNAEAWAQAAAAAAGGALMNLQQAVPSFTDLSPTLKAKFVTAGMHGAWRTVDAASAFYESSVPSAVRNLGNDAVVTFLDGKHASHIEAVVNAPGRMMDAANIVWEAARDNLARGGADMTPLELAKANALNAIQATGIVAAEALQTAAVAGCIGMALEGVVSVSENLIYVYKDEMTVQEARRKVLRDVLKKGKAAAIGGAGMTVVVALGAGPALATAAPVLVSVGGILYMVSAYSRIKTAMDSAGERPDRLPLSPPSAALGTA